MSSKAHIVKVPSGAERPPGSDLPFLEKTNFTYSKNLFYLRLILESVMIALVWVTISPMFLDVPLEWMIGILALFFIYLVLSALSPFLTSHTLSSRELVVRQGLYFKATIPIDDIRSVGVTDEFVFTGVKFAVMEQKIYVTGSRHGLVSIELERQRRFAFALGKLAKVIIIDLKNRQEFVEFLTQQLEARRSPTPASPDQSSLSQS
ncbi:MAG: hypothetical protein KAW09_12750 [Thermoplasmata archaeon]|nr:hypothetical protein [Thermoplasmata archaeon]